MENTFAVWIVLDFNTWLHIVLALHLDSIHYVQRNLQRTQTSFGFRGSYVQSPAWLDKLMLGPIC